ncbi:hypothetical protein [Vagococcus luciliae]|uniref:DUF5640 domain-containing protein n=1 Tax=Vagococcus luciliae TaxID=2920380 RepID=A0ABY5P0M3_9ENTE|nr:hypothetical protein [Vagococcus luciliae]UUV99363.1 hypothetical protein G314FT_15240 [Vagococcus luciliae]
MKDKRDLIIVILVVIIFAGGGYFLGTQNKLKNDSPQFDSTTSSMETIISSTTKQLESSTQTSIKESTKESQSTEPSLSQEDIALNKMISLQGKWAVPSTDSFLMIHEDGSWSATTVGLSEPRQLDVQIDSYNAMSDTLYVTIGGDAAQIHVITNEKIIIDYNDGTSPREYHLVN